MRCLAAASSALRPVLAGPPRSAECLGVARGALYLRVSQQPGVLAVLCHDAVRLPCGLVLPATSAEMPLTSIAPRSDSFLVGDRAVRWTGPAGPVEVRAVREWMPARPPRGAVSGSALAAVRAECRFGASSAGEGQGSRADGWKFASAGAVVNVHPWSGALADPGPDVRLLAVLAAVDGDHDASVAAAAGLLGRGPGLTPSGDDVLAGYLVGAAAFGVDAAALRAAIATLAPARTTALSAALLWHAARGECVDELAAVAAVLTGQSRQGAGRAASRLLSVGHSSGAALAEGSATAAERVLRREAERAVSRLLSVGHSSGAALACGLVIAAESALRRDKGRAA
jgi:hypothetical protein